MIPENRVSTSKAVVEVKADLGIAWDGDFDRCFFFDENGEFIENYYIVGILAQLLLEKNKEGRILHDTKLTWNSIHTVEKFGGVFKKTCHRQWLLNSRSPPVVHCCENFS